MKQRWLAVLLPVAGAVVIIAGALALRSTRPSAVASKPSASVPRHSTHEPSPLPRPPQAEKPARAEVVGQAAEQVRIRSTYDNYRTAIATENEQLRDALRPMLLRDRQAAIEIAEQQLALATDPYDFEISQKTLESLRRDE